MKKRAFMLVGILLISIVMSACSSNLKSTTNENETTIIQAEYPVYDTAEEIVDASDLVFSGTVTWILGNVTRIPRHELPQTLDFSDFLPLFT